MSAEPLIQQLQRVLNTFQDEPAVVLLELCAIGLLVYLAVRFLRGTRGAGVIKGAVLVFAVASLMISVFAEDHFERLRYLYTRFVDVIALGLIVVFQPEIRRALVRLGEARFFRGAGLRRAQVIEEILAAVTYLSKNKVGALIAIERQVGLGGIMETGTRVDATVSSQVLNTIFWPGSALHDMGVVIRGDRILAAGAQFPLADEDISQELGSRHRAAIGLSHEADCLVLVVSEETGIISVAERGQLTRELSIGDLRQQLSRGLTETPQNDVEQES